MMRRRSFASSACVHVVLMLGAAVMLLPFVWMLLTSFKPPDEIYQSAITLFPSRWYVWENFAAAFGEVPLLRFMLNGVIVTSAILILQVLVAVPCAYALAKLKFQGRSLLLSMVILGLLIPIQVPALPLYIAFANLRALDSYTALVLPFAISVFAIFLLRQFFRSFPDEIIDAARLDGLSEAAIVWRIILPSAWPVIAAFAIFSVIAHWNDLYWPLIVITTPEFATPPLGLVFFRYSSEAGGNLGPLMAAGVVTTAPLVLAFLFAQRRFVQGITMTGFK